MEGLEDRTNKLIVSVSGIRGVVGEGLTAGVALSFASAMATHVRGARIVVATDGRPSGGMLKHAVLAGLLEAGCEVHDLGVAPTPTVGIAVKKLNAAGGIQITASHNSAPWNGLKLFALAGAVLSATEGEKVKSIYERGEFRRKRFDQLGTVQPCPIAIDWHRERILELIDVAKIRKRQFRVMVDANGGAGGLLAKQLLDSLQAHTYILGGNSDGRFEHEPEPTAANLAGVCLKVASCGADVGLVLDPDADRLAIIDEAGRYIGEELTLALAVRQCLNRQIGSVVVNMSTSRVVEDVCNELGAPCFRSAVGEANVVAKMQEIGAIIGGEGNGGVIDPRVGWVRDPFIGMGLVLNLMSDSGKNLSQLVDTLPKYVIVKEKHDLENEKLPRLFDALAHRWPEARFNRVDGLRLDLDDCWLHVRPSNTEPVVRVIAEARDSQRAESLCKEVSKLVNA